MNERYLFKAKRTDNGEWVEGDILQSDDRYYIVSEFGISCIEKNKNQTGDNMITLYAFEVDPSTICQCTGIKDKNGKLIWENDILHIPYRRKDDCIVIWDDGSFRFKTIYGSYKQDPMTLLSLCFVQANVGRRRVIGNIFDKESENIGKVTW